MTYTQAQIDRANQTDLASFLQAQGETLTRSGREYALTATPQEMKPVPGFCRRFPQGSPSCGLSRQ